MTVIHVNAHGKGLKILWWKRIRKQHAKGKKKKQLHFLTTLIESIYRERNIINSAVERCTIVCRAGKTF